MSEKEKMQHTFNTVAVHLLTQNEQSLNEDGNCMYRGEHNTKCAVGCLIPDEKYQKEMEGVAVVSATCTDYFSPKEVVKQQLILSSIPEEFAHNRDLLRRLQCVHDQYTPTDWEEKLRQTAKKFDLSDEAIDAFLLAKTA